MNSNVFYDLAEYYRSATKMDGKKALGDFFMSLGLAGTPEDTKLRILSLFGEGLALISHLKLPDERVRERLELVGGIQKSFLTACNLATVAEFASKGRASIHLTNLSILGDAVHEIDISKPLDRKKFVAETQALIEEVIGADLDEYLKKALLLKLNAVRRLAQDCEQVGDDEVRVRVKSIYADCAKDFKKFDKKHEPLIEKVTAWAKGATKAGIFALALTADTTTIVPLIEDHSRENELPAPEASSADSSTDAEYGE